MNKFKQAKLWSTTALALSLSTSGFAEISSSEYSVNSISPAQRYNRETGTSGVIGYQVGTFKSKNVPLIQTDTEIVNSSLEARGHYTLPFSGFAGIGVGVENNSLKSKNIILDKAVTDKFESRSISAMPYFGLNLTPHVTVVYEATVAHMEIENDESSTVYHTLASTYHNDSFEVGAIYNHHLESEHLDIPQTFTLHGQAKVYEQLTLGVHFIYSRYDMLEGYDKTSNTQSLKLTSAFVMNDQWQLEAALARIAFNKDNFTGYETLVGVNFAVNDKLKLGSTVSYTSSSTEFTNIEDDLSLQLERGDGSFEGEQFGISFHANYAF